MLLSKLSRGLIVFSLLLPLAGCFAPLYATKTMNGQDVKRHLADIDIPVQSSRDGIILRNELLYAFNSISSSPSNPRYRLIVTMNSSSSLLVVDTQANRPQSESYNISAEFRIVDLNESTILYRGKADAAASVDTGQQRFARDRGRLDATERATKVVADQIVTQVAAYFATR